MEGCAEGEPAACRALRRRRLPESLEDAVHRASCLAGDLPACRRTIRVAPRAAAAGSLEACAVDLAQVLEETDDEAARRARHCLLASAHEGASPTLRGVACLAGAPRACEGLVPEDGPFRLVGAMHVRPPLAAAVPRAGGRLEVSRALDRPPWPPRVAEGLGFRAERPQPPPLQRQIEILDGLRVVGVAYVDGSTDLLPDGERPDTPALPGSAGGGRVVVRLAGDAIAFGPVGDTLRPWPVPKPATAPRARPDGPPPPSASLSPTGEQLVLAYADGWLVWGLDGAAPAAFTVVDTTPPKPEPSPPPAVAPRVVSVSGRVPPGALVEVFDAYGTPVDRVPLDDRGEARLPPPEPKQAPRWVQVRDPGGVASERRWLRGPRIHLRATATVPRTVEIVDDAGAVVPGARLWVTAALRQAAPPPPTDRPRRARPSSPVPPPVVHEAVPATDRGRVRFDALFDDATTDAAGAAVVRVPPGRVRIEVAAPSGAHATAEVDAGPDRPLRVALAPPTVPALRLVGDAPRDDVAAISRFIPAATAPDGTLLLPPVREGRLYDARGRFDADAVFADRGPLPRSPVGTSAVVPVGTAGLRPEGEGWDAPDATVLAARDGGPFVHPLPASRLLGGPYAVLGIRDAGLASGEAEAVPGATRTVALRPLTPAAPLHVRVLDTEGWPVANARVGTRRLLTWEGHEVPEVGMVVATTDLAGRAVLEGLYGTGWPVQVHHGRHQHVFDVGPSDGEVVLAWPRSGGR